mmetsp:Transcript_17887/g.26858  ORF Transcript_17887/g.26858 Transcript_17887/m.26858 type:complete len:352 (+) Transcript_17887:54-1109(+)|eukprot:CAMPEP_0197322062 /NCGR_PEP_ID=MMETSP0891-20130614/67986_1 /TAXON_ID=44058 ORGANISM="Aureoumbra lagunensis, Strain CCMP1510" /NCGR_SAMPLE_ID=MMETSP0891 /ASSEMBLY_ACC=CAM_ASM_000534 /LENGTH=351 /DNA_ID=CAMNT_0042814273 /DNA_START=21 /DNA_END=1076 /DNA_ORIENTATION=+
MMRKNEWFALTGLRGDGRKAEEVRAVIVDKGSRTIKADGSSWIKMGQTSVLAQCFGPQEAERRSEECVSQGVLMVQVVTSPFAYGSSRQNATSLGKDNRDMELAQIIESTMKDILMLDMYPRTIINILVNILYDDGTKLACCLNAVSLALLDAGIFLRDLPIAATVAITSKSNGQVIFDPNRQEERDGATLFHVAILPNSKQSEILFAHLETGGMMALDPYDLENILSKGIVAATITAEYFIDIYKQSTLRSLYARDLTAALTTANFCHQENASPPPPSIDDEFVHAIVDQVLTNPDLIMAQENCANFSSSSSYEDKRRLLLQYVQRNYGIGGPTLRPSCLDPQRAAANIE